jgi:hypothetical protein
MYNIHFIYFSRMCYSLLIWSGSYVNYCENDSILVEGKAFHQNLDLGQRCFPQAVLLIKASSILTSSV